MSTSGVTVLSWGVAIPGPPVADHSGAGRNPERLLRSASQEWQGFLDTGESRYDDYLFRGSYGDLLNRRGGFANRPYRRTDHVPLKLRRRPLFRPHCTGARFPAIIRSEYRRRQNPNIHTGRVENGRRHIHRMGSRVNYAGGISEAESPRCGTPGLSFALKAPAGRTPGSTSPFPPWRCPRQGHPGAGGPGQLPHPLPRHGA